MIINTTSFDDYYQVLGVTRNSSLPEIKRRYQQLLLQLHPDKLNIVDQESTQRFHQLQSAWETLKCSQKRAAYDHQLQNDINRLIVNQRAAVVVQDTLDLDDLLYDSDDDSVGDAAGVEGESGGVAWLECRCGYRIPVLLSDIIFRNLKEGKEEGKEEENEEENEEKESGLFLVQCESCSLYYHLRS